jgi:AAHS family 4-hydroxybenzoate transporter-like MFS transporter
MTARCRYWASIFSFIFIKKRDSPNWHHQSKRWDHKANRSLTMAQMASSATEHALENQRLGSLQIRVAVICGLIQMCDGYDVGSIGWSVPSLTHAWHVAPSAFALAFLWSNIGVMAGALAAGPIGDRIGRKPLLLISLALFGLASLASAFSPSLGFLAGTRFFTGAGIAGGFAGTVALTGDYTPQRLRAMMIMLTFTGAPIGGFLGGQVVALLLHMGFAWPIIFIIGGVFPLVLMAIAALWLPESPRLLAARANLAPRHQALLQRLDIAPKSEEAHAIDIARGNPIKMLFGEGFALQTTLLWIIFFCSLLNLFLFIFWLPEVLHLIGMTPAQAVFATSLQALGGIAAVLYLGWAIDRFGTRRSLAWHYAAGIVFVALISLFVLPYLALLAVVFLSGVTVIGSQTGLNAACGKLYPARMRTSGYGFATGVGRLGGIAAAPLGGFLLARGLPPTYVFLSACLFAAIAAVATAFLALPGRQTSRIAAMQTIS